MKLRFLGVDCNEFLYEVKSSSASFCTLENTVSHLIQLMLDKKISHRKLNCEVKWVMVITIKTA